MSETPDESTHTPSSAAQAEQRLDVAVVQRGLARSRTHAAELIAEGIVRVDGSPIIKPAHKVSPTSVVTVDQLDHYVSRAAHKLIAALDSFDVDVADKQALDVGASTGGFTQVLLERHAAGVVALDVGHNQISPRIRSDKRVRVLEGFNAKDISPQRLAQVLGVSQFVPDVIVADVSFISLTHILAALVSVAAPTTDFVLLIKPQFEVGRTGIRAGIVTDPKKREDAIHQVLWAAFDVGLSTAGILPSPILGTTGNHEYIAWLRFDTGVNPQEWTQHIKTISLGG